MNASPVRTHRLRRPEMLAHREGVLAVALLGAVVLVGVVGPALAPHSPAQPLGAPGQPPGGGTLLGTDILGRDVLSRVLHGGRTVLGLGIAATAGAYVAGVLGGLVAGYAKGWRDSAIMRSVDVLLSFPALLLLLLLITGLGSSIPVLILSVAVVLAPGVARIVRTATLEIATKGYVEDAIARGEKTRHIFRREILPNIIEFILADFGIRFGYAIILMASVNYLGLGLKPPAADWGLMISENRNIIASNPWAVVAPAVMLALLTVSVNLVADAYTRTLGRSRVDGNAEQADIGGAVAGMGDGGVARAV